MAGTSRNFIELDHYQQAKHGQFVAGDVFLCQKIKEEDRAVAVLSDGLGSGIKASVLATLTATMALRYTSSFMDIKQSAETIMETLPICSVRRIGYSTFTIVDIEAGGETRMIEYGNPPSLLMRNGREQPVERTTLELRKWQDRVIHYSRFRAELGDRIVFFSDGISQAGMGEYRTPLGWGLPSVCEFVGEEIAEDREISARVLAKRLVAKAEEIDGGLAKDDITCGVIYFREPRRLLVLTGPPYSPARDPELARIALGYKGRKAICGGTTANIIARLLERRIRVKMSDVDPEIPPGALMDGIDLITEGTITLGRAATVLEDGVAPETLKRTAATDLVSLLLDSDVVQFVVGTRINQAHQDPNIPVELELRRNIVKKIAALLETKHAKETHIQYL